MNFNNLRDKRCPNCNDVILCDSNIWSCVSCDFTITSDQLIIKVTEWKIDKEILIFDFILPLALLIATIFAVIRFKQIF